jgi:diguanylate cyclase (GGDEF)-like protein
MTQIHDYTKLAWGDEFMLEAPLEGITGEMIGQGDVQPGDSILVCVRCRVVEIEHYAEPPDMWRAKVSFLAPSSMEELSEPVKFQLLKQAATQFGNTIQQSELYQQLQRLLSSDPLTQVANRQRFEECLTQEWRRMMREQTPLSLILCKFDGLALDHSPTSKNQLRQIAATIQQAARRPSDLVARYQEDTFAVLLPNTPLQGAVHVAGKIRSQVQALGEAGLAIQLRSPLRVCLGIATQIPQQGSKTTDLSQGAEQALQTALAGGEDIVSKDTSASS